MKKFSGQQLRFRFYDVQANIRSDVPVFLDIFKKMYPRFQTGPISPPPRPPIDFTVKARPQSPGAPPTLSIDGEVRRLNNPALLEGHVYENILHSILSRVRSHFLIHAGVVSLNGQGLILAGKGGHGKTTLVLELVRRGFRFLSDEMAALGRQDHLVHPFPRSLRIRPGTLELTGFAASAKGAATWLDKLLIDIEKIKPHCLGETVPPAHVVILRNPAENGQAATDRPVQELVILVDRLDPIMIDAISRIEGVENVHFGEDGPLPVLRLLKFKGYPVLADIEEIGRQRRVHILNIIKDDFSKPRFDAAPRLEPIARSQAVMELLRNFQGGHKSALLREDCDGRTTRLFMEMSAIIREADCYQLFVGSLDGMADLVHGLFEKKMTAAGV